MRVAAIMKLAAGASRRAAGLATPAGRTIERVRWRLRSGDLDAAHAAAAAGVAAHPEHPRVHDLLIGILDRREAHHEALERSVENAHRYLRRLPPPADPPRELGRDQRIFLSGYFQSGSSAVMDYLSGFAGVSTWAPAGEWRLVKSVGGVADLGARHKETSKLSAQDLVDFYLHVTGQKLTSTARGRYDRWRVVNRNSAALSRDPRAAGYLRACLESFLELVELATGTIQPSRKELDRFFRARVARALDLAAAGVGAEVLLLDQGINAWRLPISRYVPPATFVVVHRDPRDQFVDASAALRRRGQTPKPAAVFAEGYRRRREKAVRAMPKVARRYGHRFLTVGFEEFVHDPEAVRGLVDALGLADRSYLRGRYRPRRAAAAVGVHQRTIDPAEAATIAEALPEFLDPRAAVTCGQGEFTAG